VTPLLVAILAAACGSSGGPGASPGTSPGASPGSSPGATPGTPASPSPDAIGHPTGATDIVLRLSEGGGFSMPGFSAGETPIFTLYGDGLVVFQGVEPPEWGPDGTIVPAPMRTARLAPDQVQSLLEFALIQGGLATARPKYDNPMIADAPTATFEIHVDGLDKTVSVYALGLDAEPGQPDSAIKTAMVKLADRLRDFDHGGAFGSETYVPEAYRGVVFEAGPVENVVVKPWPWPTLSPADFVRPADPNHPVGFPHRTLTPEEAAAVGFERFEGGLNQVYLEGPDGKTYLFVLRPLLPGEEE
jgi:hypothetical protein